MKKRWVVCPQCDLLRELIAYQWTSRLTLGYSDVSSPQRPELETVDTKMTHAQKKIRTIEKNIASLQKERDDKESAIKSITKELAQVEKIVRKQKEEADTRFGRQGVSLNTADLREYQEL